ncbi:MAG: GxxExxY protein [Bacteroidota bacterium]
MLHENITAKIIQAYYNVYNTLGYGFLEKVYENALALELEDLGCRTERQKSLNVFYNGSLVGEYFADVIVENVVIVELKSSEALRVEHEAQLTNYLRATEIEVGLLLNFGKKAEFRRKLFSNDKKHRSNI